MVKVRLADETDLDAWQSFVDHSPDAGCMHHAGWFRVLRDAYRVVPSFFLALGDHGTIQGILPAYYSRSVFTGHHISSLEDGVLARNPQAARALLADALVLRDKFHAQYLQMRGGMAGDVSPDLSISTVRTFILTNQPKDALWAAVKKKTRWAIRQAEKQSITIEHDGALGALGDFYMVYAAHMRHLGTPVVGRDSFEAMRTHLGPARLRLYLVKYRHRLIGGMLCITNGVRWTDYYAAVRTTPEMEFANYLLYWHVICDAASLGIERFDLGRSTPGSGVHLFKRKWGGVDVEVPYRFYVAPDARPRNLGLQQMKQTKGLAQRVWPHLPLVVCNRLGPLLRKQLPFI